MDEHLTRARDINREISRQLKPLERQVDRARKYKDLSARANELTQILAVDELRQLQAQWVDLESASRESAEMCIRDRCKPTRWSRACAP